MRTYSNFILDEKGDFVFCYVPKVACTNWKCILRKSQGYSDWLDTKICHNRQANGLKFLNPTNQEDLRTILAVKHRFLMVRNPYSRALSAYLNKIESRLKGTALKPRTDNDHWYSVAKEISAFEKDWLVSLNQKDRFYVFLRWLSESNDWATTDEHWAPQHEIARPDTVPFSDVLKFEDLPKSGQILLGKMGLDFEFPSQEAVRFPGTSATDRMDCFYTSETRELAYDLYSKDFDYFGY